MSCPKCKILEADNLRLAQKKVKDMKMSTLVFWRDGDGLAAGNVIDQIGTTAKVKRLFPAPTSDALMPNSALFAVADVSRWFIQVEAQNRRMKSLIDEIARMAAEPAAADSDGRRPDRITKEDLNGEE